MFMVSGWGGLICDQHWMALNPKGVLIVDDWG